MYTDFAKSNKPGELSNEGMFLSLDRNTRTAKGTNLSGRFIASINYLIEKL